MFAPGTHTSFGFTFCAIIFYSTSAGMISGSLSSERFSSAVISAATFLSEHYHSFSPHIQTLSKLSIKIFDAMKQEHGLGKRARLLLQVATILHDCGKYVSFAEASESTYHIIMSSEIIGLIQRICHTKNCRKFCHAKILFLTQHIGDFLIRVQRKGEKTRDYGRGI